MSAAVHAKVVIIGSGPAGYTAAIYAARAMLEPILIQGIQPGGQLTITTDVENYPGFADVIQGPWLMEQMEKQALHVGTQIKTDLVIKLDTTQRPFRLTCDSGDVYLAETVILATGAQARWLGISSEENFKGFGVSACATCDGFFYRGKEVVVVGGGNTAVEEALFLTNFASQVTVVHRRDHFRAPSASCRTAYSSIPRSRWSGTTPSTRSAAKAIRARSLMSVSRTSSPARSPSTRPTVSSSLSGMRRRPSW
ncbi:thioredoxin reductase [Bradyrhizobium sp. LM2.9]